MFFDKKKMNAVNQKQEQTLSPWNGTRGGVVNIFR